MSRVLAFSCTHCPAMIPGFIPFLKSVQHRYKTDKTVHLGDVVDWSSISYHPKAPSLRNSDEEYHKAFKQVQQIYKAFPEASWLLGNHDALTERHAMDVGLPMSVFKDYREMWGVKRWKVVPRFGALKIDGVLYQHGDRGRGGKTSAVLNMQSEFNSVVQGHHHSQAGVWYNANQHVCTFGLQVGCGVDHHVEAMQYGKKYNQKPIVGCGVVIDGRVGLFEPMPL